MAESVTARNCTRTGQIRRPAAAGFMLPRVYDSRSERECLENVQVFFSDIATRAIVDEANLVKPIDAQVVDVTVDVDPTSFREGCYTVDCTYYFSIRLNTYRTRGDVPIPVTGRAFHVTRSVLFGGKGGVKTFSSTGVSSEDAPVATVQVSEPVVLSAYITEEPACPETPFDLCPPCPESESGKTVLATIGLFSVVSLERTVQVTLPVLRYGVPPVRGAQTEEDPCAVFRRMRFPAGSFCPE